MKLSFLFLFFLSLSTNNFAANYYVATTNGNDSNTGTEAQPWKTITKAANTLIAGDTVFVKAGTYPERVLIQNSGTANNHIVVTNYQADIVIIDGTNVSWGAGWFGLVDVSYKNYISIIGLQVKNSEYGGIWTDSSNYLLIKDNYTYNTVSSGIGIWNNNYVTAEGNDVELACSTGGDKIFTARRDKE